MKKIVIVLMSLVASVYFMSAQEVTFRVIDGTDDTAVKDAVENNVSALLSAINKSQSMGTDMDFSAVLIDDGAKESFEMLWSNIPFHVIENEIAEHLLTTYDNNYQIRNIPIELNPDNASDDIDNYQEAVIDVDKNGRILSFFFSIQANIYRRVMKDGQAIEDLRHRQMILDYVEHFRTAYNQKDIKFLEQVFSDDALIITGKVVRVAKSDLNMLSNRRIEYTVQNKKQYLTRLKSVFDRAKYIHVDFSEIKVSRHPTKMNFYGVLVRQGYDSGQYSDDGYVFLLWDFSDEERPQIHVRTWQPYWMDEQKTTTLPEKEIMDINTFKL